MGRPSKNKETERNDTIFWTGLIVKNTGLSDLAIVKLLYDRDDAGFDEENARRAFARWRTGQRAMSLDELANFVRKARSAGLLPPRSGLIDAPEGRLFLRTGGKPSVELAREAREFRRLHAARDAACKAIDAYSAALRETNCTAVLESREDNEEFDDVLPSHIEKLSERLRAHIFVNLGHGPGDQK